MKKKIYGTAKSLQLVRGDLVEMVEKEEVEINKFKTKNRDIGIVLCGPQREFDYTRVLLIWSSWMPQKRLADKEFIGAVHFVDVSFIGDSKNVHSGFAGFRRLMPAEAMLPRIKNLAAGLAEFT